MSEITGNIGSDEMYCFSCGKVVLRMAVACPFCGVSLTGVPQSGAGVSSKSRTVMLLLCYFFGWIGLHRFYAGKAGTGVLWLFTLGVFGIGALIDMVWIILGRFKDVDNKEILNWQ